MKSADHKAVDDYRAVHIRHPQPSAADLVAVQQFCGTHSIPVEHGFWLEAVLRGNSISIIEHRRTPDSDYDPSIQPENGTRIAMLRFDPSVLTWSLYWLNRNDKPLLYDAQPARTIKTLLKRIEEDSHGCFFI